DRRPRGRSPLRDRRPRAPRQEGAEGGRRLGRRRRAGIRRQGVAARRDARRVHRRGARAGLGPEPQAPRQVRRRRILVDDDRDGPRGSMNTTKPSRSAHGLWLLVVAFVGELALAFFTKMAIPMLALIHVG